MSGDEPRPVDALAVAWSDRIVALLALSEAAIAYRDLSRMPVPQSYALQVELSAQLSRARAELFDATDQLSANNAHIRQLLADREGDGDEGDDDGDGR